MKLLPLIPGERAWKAADRACGAPPLEDKYVDGRLVSNGREHYDAIRNAGDDWAEIDEEAQWEALEVLPPRYFPGGFAVSEPVCHDDEGRTVYLCVLGHAGHYYARYSSIRNTLRDELLAVLNLAI